MSARLLFTILFATPLVALADEHEHKMDQMPLVKPPALFGQLTGLVGTWEGTEPLPDGGQKQVAVEYSLTSAGTALVERISPGDDHEMISVYHGKGEGLMMTHFCALGNQPRMECAKAEEPGVLVFEFAGAENLGSPNDPHMHALTLTIIDDNHISHNWKYHVGGQEAGSSVIEFTRKKPPTDRVSE